MNWYASDLHLGDYRVIPNTIDNFRHRPFATITQHNKTILDNFRKAGIRSSDTVFYGGDVAFTEQSVELLAFLPVSRRILIVGNHDVDKIDLLSPYFDEIVLKTHFHTLPSGLKVAIAHYPVDAISAVLDPTNDSEYAICGHIHGMWLFQRNAVNIGIDAWSWGPVREDKLDYEIQGKLKHCMNDYNCFPYDNVVVKVSKSE